MPTKTKFYVVFYKDAKKEWRWHIKHCNGNIICCSSEGYDRFGKAEKSFFNLISFIELSNMQVYKEDELVEYI